MPFLKSKETENLGQPSAEKWTGPETQLHSSCKIDSLFSENQKDQDTYVLLLMYAYKKYTHLVIGAAHFSVIVPRKLA